ncbi:HNH endonuclease signature motif containing protein [Geobacillus thermodenitrificans]|uniref:HNH endonuclease n=1 Tax=Geobacillus thermodenitrificans TaxID=33940 RepID=UPI003D1F98FE
MNGGTKQCSLCNKLKTFDNYYSQQKTDSKGNVYIYYYPYCKECAKEKATLWNKMNKLKRSLIQKRHNNKKEVREKKRINTEIRRKNGVRKKWEQRNKDKLRKYNEKRLHKNHEISKEEWESCLKYFNYSCAYCGISENEAKNKYKQKLHKEHVDHNGANDLSNCVPACRSCNSQKWKYEFEEWYNENNPVFDEERFNRIKKWIKEDYKLFK